MLSQFWEASIANPVPDLVSRRVSRGRDTGTGNGPSAAGFTRPRCQPMDGKRSRIREEKAGRAVDLDWVGRVGLGETGS